MTDQGCIVVNYELLGRSASSLRSIGDEFANTDLTRDHLVAHLGSHDIAEALGEFTGNWDRKRRELTTKIREAENVFRSVMASFSEQDRKAANFDLSHKAGPMMTTSETSR
jgi:hypothetical protein